MVCVFCVVVCLLMYVIFGRLLTVFNDTVYFTVVGVSKSISVSGLRILSVCNQINLSNFDFVFL